MDKVKTLQELLEERDQLDKQIRAAHKAEVSDKIATIKLWIKQYDLTAKDLGLRVETPGVVETILNEHLPDKRKGPTKPKYVNPKNPNEFWTGRGAKTKRPKWVLEYEKAGGNIEDCLIKES